MSKIFAVALAASFFLSGASVEAQVREPVSIKVRHADLDFHRPDHRAMLDARIRRAAAIACGPMTNDLAQNEGVARCRAEMRADADVKVAALLAAPVMLASTR